MQCWQLFRIQHKCNLNFRWSFVHDFYCLSFINDLCLLVLINSLNTILQWKKFHIQWKVQILTKTATLTTNMHCNLVSSSVMSSSFIFFTIFLHSSLMCLGVHGGAFNITKRQCWQEKTAKGQIWPALNIFLVGRCILQKTYSTSMQLLSWGWGEVITI